MSNFLSLLAFIFIIYF